MLVEDAARNGSNLMPLIIHAVESYCTVGEIASRLRIVFGEYKEEVLV
jgi:methylmalonyl-CoA mutase N-terminal domain/subunit